MCVHVWVLWHVNVDGYSYMYKIEVKTAQNCQILNEITNRLMLKF